MLHVDPIRAKRKELRTGFVCVANHGGDQTLADISCLDATSLQNWLDEKSERAQQVVMVLLKHWSILTEVG